MLVSVVGANVEGGRGLVGARGGSMRVLVCIGGESV